MLDLPILTRSLTLILDSQDITILLMYTLIPTCHGHVVLHNVQGKIYSLAIDKTLHVHGLMEFYKTYHLLIVSSHTNVTHTHTHTNLLTHSLTHSLTFYATLH